MLLLDWIELVSLLCANLQEMIDAGRLPKPGEGPLPELRAKSAFSTTHYAESVTGRKAMARVSGGEAGCKNKQSLKRFGVLNLNAHRLQLK